MSSTLRQGLRSIFCIDTSALLHGWKRDYPPDVFSSIWRDLEELAEIGLLIAPKEVLLELERGGDDVYAWAKAREAMFLEPDDNVQKQVAQIVNTYPSFVPEESRDGIWADPYVIGLAVTKEATVVTGETLAGPNAKIVRIPDICTVLKVPYVAFLDLLRSSGRQY